MKTSSTLLLYFTVLALFGGSYTLAGENLFARPQGGQNVVGIKLGVVNGATFKVTDRKTHSSDSTHHSRAGVMGGIFFDMRLSESSHLSFDVDITDIGVNNDREKLLDLSLAFKHRISPAGSPFVLRPAVGAGLGYMADMHFLKASSFFTLKGYCEMLLQAEKPHSYLFELGLVGAPSGGNATSDVRFTPMVYFRVGIVY